MEPAAIDRVENATPCQLGGHRTSSAGVNLAVVLIVSILVRGAYLIAKPASVRSLDTIAWEQAVNSLGTGEDIYVDTGFNWLPPLPQVVASLKPLARITGVQFLTLFWALLILIESALVIVMLGMMLSVVSASTARNVLLAAIALNPAAVFQVTQHGNFHVLTMLWVMLSIGALRRFHDRRHVSDWLLACGWLGLGVLTKTVPLALAPLLAAGTRRLSLPILLAGALLLFGPVAIGLAFVVPREPREVFDNIVLYHSFHSFFGVSGLVAMMDGVEFPRTGPLLQLHAKLFVTVSPIVLAGIAVLLWRKGWNDRRQVSLSAGLILTAIVALGTGFGVQYVEWLVPPLAVAWVEFSDPKWRRLLLIALVITAATCTFEYLTMPSLGALLSAWYRDSLRLYIIRLRWMHAADQTMLRLPMFCAFVAILISGVRLLLSTKPERAILGEGI